MKDKLPVLEADILKFFSTPINVIEDDLATRNNVDQSRLIKRRRRRKVSISLNVILTLLIVIIVSLAIRFVLKEVKTSELQAKFFSYYADKLETTIASAPSNRIRFPETGPYDGRLGYIHLPNIIRRLLGRSYNIVRQARINPLHASLIDLGINPIYTEKNQTGLTLYSRDSDIMFKANFPSRVYQRFEDIPPVIWRSLLFIEDRHLLDANKIYHNPAVEWDRFGRAILDVFIQKFSDEHHVQGGSTLATQLEKFRHSDEGRTKGIKNKLLQMASASLRAYRYGSKTWDTRKETVLNYINSVPLAAVSGFGEVNGFGDGIKAYYGREFGDVNRLLSTDINQFKNLSPKDQDLYADLFIEMVSLFLAHKRPSYYLRVAPESLNSQIIKFLPLFLQEGIISSEIKALVDKKNVNFRRTWMPEPQKGSFLDRKGAYSLRANLLSLLGVSSMYDLDRYDLSVISTIDEKAQNGVVKLLNSLKDEKVVQKNLMVGKHLFKPKNDLNSVVISFTLYEKGEEGNFLRVQADNYDQPLNINEGVKLDLGSTAKLRTLTTYLEIIAKQYKLYSDKTFPELVKLNKEEQDPLTKWSIDFLVKAKNPNLKNAKPPKLADILQAAMLRKYSASPGESFFTAGGLHVFHNFNNLFNGQIVTLATALRHSINLPFIRLMRDIVRYYSTFVVTGELSLRSFKTMTPEVRERYLQRFATIEGRKFLSGFYKKYVGKNNTEIIEELVKGTRRIQNRLAVFAWMIKPTEDYNQFRSMVATLAPKIVMKERELRSVYDVIVRYRESLQDLSYIARIHPLEIWVATYLYKKPKTTFTKIIEISDDVILKSYSWLFKTRYRYTQDKRIKIMMESESFHHIHQAWKRLGYPHDSLVPSYATALGVSADTPDGLAKLLGIIQNDGKKRPYIRFKHLGFAVGTPFETVFEPDKVSGEQVLEEEIAKVLKTALFDVVQNGTALRIRNGLKADKEVFPVGGKTGTGDHRHKVFRGGGLVSAEVKNRSANFTFLIGDKFFGTLTIFVPGKAAAQFEFTSSLAVQILKYLEPALAPLLIR
jgi:membrane peptidoglycan carboxypeptidase